jgi:hypothetical protein
MYFFYDKWDLQIIVDSKVGLFKRNKKTKLHGLSELYRQTERPPLVGEVSANFSG